jgi:uncharacterized repeat protein (TIGR03803 family)
MSIHRHRWDRNRSWMNAACALLLVVAMTAAASSTQTFTMVHDFDGTDGDGPYAALIQAHDGYLYGTTSEGGAGYGEGTVFKMTPSGTLTTLHTFYGPDGSSPAAALTQATDGFFYGTTETGGAVSKSCQYGCGTIFKIGARGEFATLHRFVGTDGAYPYGGLVQASDGNLYGTTEFHGAHDFGTVFMMTPRGRFKTLHDFSSVDGAYPFAGLIQASDGNLYGTTDSGGRTDHGTVFRMTLDGKLSTVRSFDGTDGGYPRAALVQATHGNLFGTTEYGVYPGGHYLGTVFKLTLDGQLTNLHTFQGADGANPYGGLVWATDGNLYGTTLNGGALDDGAIFKITPSGRLTTIYSFENSQAYPFAGLVQATNGRFYGTTYEGGTNDCGGFFCGTVYSLSVGLGQGSAFTSWP